MSECLSPETLARLQRNAEEALRDEFGWDASHFARPVLDLLAEITRLREALVTHRVAAAILVGTLAATQREVLDWACAPGQQPETTAAATRQIVADARRYEEGTAGTFEADIRAALGGGRDD